MSALCANARVSEAELAEIRAVFNSFGVCEFVPESMMDTVVGVSGSSPAYVYLFIEAMADAAVADGMPRAQAYKFAAQSVLGSAKMVLETGSHPGALKDAVCSPGGTTIEAVAILEEEGMRHAVIRAQRPACRNQRIWGNNQAASKADSSYGRQGRTPVMFCLYLPPVFPSARLPAFLPPRQHLSRAICITYFHTVPNELCHMYTSIFPMCI